MLAFDTKTTMYKRWGKVDFAQFAIPTHTMFKSFHIFIPQHDMSPPTVVFSRHRNK